MKNRVYSRNPACPKKCFVRNEMRMTCTERMNDAARGKCVGHKRTSLSDIVCLRALNSFEYCLQANDVFEARHAPNILLVQFYLWFNFSIISQLTCQPSDSHPSKYAPITGSNAGGTIEALGISWFNVSTNCWRNRLHDSKTAP